MRVDHGLLVMSHAEAIEQDAASTRTERQRQDEIRLMRQYVRGKYRFDHDLMIHWAVNGALASLKAARRGDHPGSEWWLHQVAWYRKQARRPRLPGPNYL